MEAIEITGNVYAVGETQEFTSGFCKRELIIEVEDGKYKNLYGFEAVKDKVSLFDGLSAGQEVTVKAFPARTRESEYNGETRFWASFPTAFAVSKGESAKPDKQPVDDEGDNLPF